MRKSISKILVGIVVLISISTTVFADGTFKPDKTISNAEFITIVNKMI